MKKTGLYWEAYYYPYEFHVFRLGWTTWRFNAQNLESGETSTYTMVGDDETAYSEFDRVKHKCLEGFREWK